MEKKTLMSILFIAFFIGIISFCVFIYSDKNIFSPGSGKFNDDKNFVENQIFVYFEDNISFNKIKRFVIKIDGKIDAYEESVINSYAITLDNVFDIEEDVDDYCNKLLNKYNILEDCFPNYISYPR